MKCFFFYLAYVMQRHYIIGVLDVVYYIFISMDNITFSRFKKRNPYNFNCIKQYL